MSVRVLVMDGVVSRTPAVARELEARAERWANEVGTVERVAHGVGAAVQRLFDAGDGPVLVTWPELVRWRSDHAAGALDDLADGCAISLGPMFDGGFYLVAFARPVPSLLALPDDAWRASDPLRLATEAAGHDGFIIGLLRTERGLHTPADVTALLADPLLDDDLRQRLS